MGLKTGEHLPHGTYAGRRGLSFGSALGGVLRGADHLRVLLEDFGWREHEA